MAKKSKNKKSKRGLAEDDVVVEKTVAKRKKKNRRLNVVGGTSYGVEDDLSMINTHVSSEVADKEVFASGDKIMVSVNFRSSNRNVASPPRRTKNRGVGKATAISSATSVANAKPMCVIDIMQSPYRIIEESPKEVFDVYSDDENDTRKKVGNTATNASNNNNNINSNSTNNVGKNQQKVSKQKPTPPIDSSSQHKAPSPKETAEKQQQQLQQLQQLQQQVQLQNQQLSLQEHYEGGDLIIHTGVNVIKLFFLLLY